MTIKTKASHQLWLFKAKNCYLDVNLINWSRSWFCNAAQWRSNSELILSFYIYNEALQWQKTRGSLAKQERAPLSFSHLGVRPPSHLFPFPCWRAGRVTDTEGSQQRVWQPRSKPQQGSASDWRASGCTRSPTQAFIGPSPSHLSHKIGFVEALPSAEKAKVDYGGRRSWNGITSGMVPNITPDCLNANHHWIMNDLCSLLSRLAWLGKHFSYIFALPSLKKT